MLAVDGFSQMACPYGADACDPRYPHVLFVYTPDATVMYHGPQFAVVNATERLTTTLKLNGMADEYSINGRHLLDFNTGVFLLGGGGIVNIIGMMVGVSLMAPAVITGGTIIGAGMAVVGVYEILRNS
jgi:hypothetical protein